jgi:hypothetical protein
MKKLFGSLVLILISGVILISCGKKPATVVKEYEEAFNSHNVNKLVSLFSDTAEIELSQLNKLKGHIKIRGYAEYDSALNSRITISDIAENDGRAFFVMNKQNDFLKSIGINEAKYSMIFKIDGGKIVDISGTTTHETDNKLMEFQDPFMLWASRKKLDVLNEIMPNGNIVYNAENAIKYLALVLEWKRDNNPSFVRSPAGKKTDSNRQ